MKRYRELILVLIVAFIIHLTWVKEITLGDIATSLSISIVGCAFVLALFHWIKYLIKR